MTGTVAGARRALGAIGVTVDWQQWWQQEPPGHHDTHVVTAYVNRHLFADQPALLTEETQYAVLRLIRATQRWSQEIDFRLGVGFAAGAGLAGALQPAAVAAPTLETVTQMPAAAIGAATFLQDAAFLAPSAGTVSQHPGATFALSGGVRAVQFVHATMEATA